MEHCCEYCKYCINKMLDLYCIKRQHKVLKRESCMEWKSEKNRCRKNHKGK